MTSGSGETPELRQRNFELAQRERLRDADFVDRTFRAVLLAIVRTHEESPRRHDHQRTAVGAIHQSLHGGSVRKVGAHRQQRGANQQTGEACALTHTAASKRRGSTLRMNNEIISACPMHSSEARMKAIS
jgi:hypothetical protein